MRALQGRALWITGCFFAGAAVLLVTERVLGPGGARTASRALGGALVVASLLARAGRVARAGSRAARVERWLLAAQGVGALALVLHLSSYPAAAAVWPFLLAAAGLPLLFMEHAAGSMVGGESLDQRRIARSAVSGLELSCVLAAAFAVNYVGARHDVQVDLGYLQATRPSQATRQLATSLKEGVEVRAFFPRPNEARDRLESYFAQLRTPLLRAEFFDVATDPEAAAHARVRQNGVVVVSRGERQVRIDVGVEWEAAKPKLGTFDVDLQWALAKVSRSHVAYFLSGHGERDTGDDRRGPPPGARMDNPTPGISLNGESTEALRFTSFHTLLSRQGYQLRRLGADNGLASGIPRDASVVIWVGPHDALAPGETALLRHYLDAGGRLLLFLDASAPAAPEELLRAWRLRFVPEVLANDATFLRRTYRPSDQRLLLVTSFGTHPAVLNLSRDPTRYPVLMPDSGHLELLPGDGTAPATYATMAAPPQTWADADGDLRFDPEREARRPYVVAAAAVGPDRGQGEGRLLAYASVEMVADGVVEQVPNQQALLDALAYLTADEAIAVAAPPSDPVIRHSRQQDAVWFYSVSVGVPLLALAVGLSFNRRRRSR